MKKTLLIASFAALAFVAGCSCDDKDTTTKSDSTKSGSMGVVSDTHKDCTKGSCSDQGSCCTSKSAGDTKQN